jgi:hypothetical protein
MNKTPEISLKDLIHSSIVSGKLSSILSTKGISVRYSDTAKTASINFGENEIVFPMFANMTNVDVHMTMLAHETAHLLFSDMETCLSAHRAGVEHGIHNIVLDIRDERLFKKEYPGFVKYFIKGYEFLLNDGFFGDISEIPFSNFPTRLNCYAKLGFPLNSFIPLSESELDFYNRCMLAETNDDINRLSVELYAMSRKNQENIWEQLKNATEEELAGLMQKITESEVDEDGQPMELTEDQIHALSEILKGNRTAGHKQNELLEDLVEKLDTNPMEISEKSMSGQLLSGISTVVYQQRKAAFIVSAKEFLEKTDLGWPTRTEEISTAVSFKSSFQNSVKHMAMMFEARKSAHRMMNRKLDKQGTLDSGRLALYKVSDNLFRTKYKQGNAKNHALIMLLDCSGSIANMFNDMLQQVVTISEFCRAVSIPFKVFMFGADIQKLEYQHEEYAIQGTSESKFFNTFCHSYGTNTPLIECLSSEQSLGDYHVSISRLYRRRGWAFGSTPTMSAIANLELVIPKFFAHIDQRKVFLITDGDPTDSPYLDRKKYVYDPMTKTGFINTSSGRYASIDIMSRIFKQRYDVTLSTMAVSKTSNSLRQMASRILGDVPLQFAGSLKEYGVADLKTKNNFPALFIRSVGVEDDDYSVSIEEGDTVAKIKNKFSKNFGRIRKSKIMLNILVDNLAI